MSILPLALLVLLAAQPAPAAASPAPAEVSQMASAFRAICLEHLADAGAQAAVARAAPWNFSPDGRTEDHTDRYRSTLGMLGIRQAPQFCALTAAMRPGVDVASFQAAMAAVLPLGPSATLEAPDSVYWTIEADGSHDQYFIALKASDHAGRVLATFTLQKRQS
jgi:hypothetical protein